MKCNDVLVITYEDMQEDAATKAVEKLKILLQSVPQIAWIASPDGSITYFNER